MKIEVEEYLTRLANAVQEAATCYRAGEAVEALDSLDSVISLAQTSVVLIQRELQSS